MRTASILFLILLVAAALAGAGYYGVPFIVKKETGMVRSEIRDLKERLQKVEEFVTSEQERRASAGLPPDADFQSVIEAVNGVTKRVAAMEQSFHGVSSSTEAFIAQQKASSEQAMTRQADSLSRSSREMETKLKEQQFRLSVAGMMGHVLKLKMDLTDRNIGTAKVELENISALLETIKEEAGDEKRAALDEIHGVLKKARAEVESDLPAAISRVDLVWRELSRFLTKS